MKTINDLEGLLGSYNELKSPFSEQVQSTKVPTVDNTSTMEAAREPAALSSVGADLIKGEEAFVPYLYDDFTRKRLTKEDIEKQNFKGTPTLGYGTTFTPEELTSGKAYDTDIYGDIDRSKANQMFKNHPVMKDVETVIEKQITPELRKQLTQEQEDALYSFGYNVGPAALTKVIETYNKDGLEAAVDRLKKYTRSKGKELGGLVKRRNLEADYLLGKKKYKTEESEKMEDDKKTRDPASVQDASQQLPKPDFLNSLMQEYQSLKDQRGKGLESAQTMDAISQITSQFGRLAPTKVDIAPTTFEKDELARQGRSLDEMGKIKDLTRSAKGTFSNDPNSDASRRARDVLNGLGIKVPEGMTEEFAAKLAPGLIATERAKTTETGKTVRQDKALDFQKEKTDRPSDKQVEKIESLKFAQDLTSRIKEQFKLPSVKDNLGPYASRLESAKSFVPGLEQDPEFVKFKANAVESLASYIKDKSGAQVSDTERRFLEGALPSVTDKPGEFEAKLGEFEKRLAMVEEGRFETIEAQGKNLSKMKEVMKTTDKSASDSNQVRRKTKDGRTAIFDAATKKFIKYEE